jgi:hypothetical protein
MDIARAAMAADIARTVVLLIGGWGDNYVVPNWLGLSDTHHALAHANGAGKKAFDKWLMQQVAYLIGSFKSTAEANGTLLDNTVMAFATNMDYGNGHKISDVPWILAGKCGGYFKTGQMINVTTAHTDVLNAIADAMGVPIAGYTQPEYRGLMTQLKA